MTQTLIAYPFRSVLVVVFLLASLFGLYLWRFAPGHIWLDNECTSYIRFHHSSGLAIGRSDSFISESIPSDQRETFFGVIRREDYQQWNDPQTTLRQQKRWVLWIIPYWMMLLLPLGATLFWGLGYLRIRKMARWKRTGMCGNCGYDCRATQGRCPECGSAV